MPPKTRPDLTPSDPEALTVGEEFNDAAVRAFKAKEWQKCYDLSSEAIRLNPRKKEYLANRAAAGLKLGKAKRFLRQAAEDSVNAYEMDAHYTKAYVRAAEAHLALNERATVKLAVQELQQALNLEPVRCATPRARATPRATPRARAMPRTRARRGAIGTERSQWSDRHRAIAMERSPQSDRNGAIAAERSPRGACS